MNAERLIGMIVRMVLRKGMTHFAKGRTGARSNGAHQAARKARQAARLTRKL